MIESGYHAGELVIMGFEGKMLSAETIQNLTQEKVTQFILFTHNFENPEQLIALTDQLQSFAATQLPFMISADQEGGRVQRFKNGFTLLPSAKKVAEKGSPQLAFELSKIQARELKAAGIQLNFSPVADINTNPKNPVIGDRAYGDSEETVSKMVTAVVRGHAAENVEPCLKHFPGHGDTHLDSHFDLPTVMTPLELLRTREWIPFQKAIKSGCRFVMSAHLLLPHVDPKFPATLSKTFLQNFLRNELYYQGVIVSDDMQMHAITKNYGAEEAPLLALEAGCDLLCYRSEDQTLIAIEAIKKAISSGRLNRELLKKSIDRIRAVRKDIQLASLTASPADRLAQIGLRESAEFAASF